jgi:hypothetical protein
MTIRQQSAPIALVLFAALACDSTQGPVSPPPTSQLSGNSGTGTPMSALGLKFLAPGVPVPPGTVPDGIPEPYNASVGNHAVPTTLVLIPNPGISTASRDSLTQVAGPRLSSATRIPGPVSSLSLQGLFSPGGDGIYVFTSLPVGTVLPVNTTYEEDIEVNHESGNTCSNAGVIADRPAGASTVTTSYFEDGIGCAGASYAIMDATFQSKYTRTYSGVLMFVSQIIRISGNCWQTQLFNFTSAQWEIVENRCQGSDQTLLTFYDTFNLLSCPTIPSIYVNSFLIDYGGAWSLPGFPSAAQFNGTDYCFTTGQYSFVINSNNAWTAQTPNP